MENKIIQRIACKAVIINKDGKVLLIREAKTYKKGSNIGKYDFPGGKIEPGESIKNALLRETKEECGLDIEIGEPFFVREWNPAVRGNEFQIIGIYFKCIPKNVDIALNSDYDDYKWIDTEHYNKFDLIAPEVIDAVK